MTCAPPSPPSTTLNVLSRTSLRGPHRRFDTRNRYLSRCPTTPLTAYLQSPGEHRTRLGWVSDDGGKDEDLNVMSCDVGVFAIGNDAEQQTQGGCNEKLGQVLGVDAAPEVLPGVLAEHGFLPRFGQPRYGGAVGQHLGDGAFISRFGDGFE